MFLMLSQVAYPCNCYSIINSQGPVLNKTPSLPPVGFFFFGGLFVGFCLFFSDYIHMSQLKPILNKGAANPPVIFPTKLQQ